MERKENESYETYRARRARRAAADQALKNSLRYLSGGTIGTRAELRSKRTRTGSYGRDLLAALAKSNVTSRRVAAHKSHLNHQTARRAERESARALA